MQLFTGLIAHASQTCLTLERISQTTDLHGHLWPDLDILHMADPYLPLPGSRGALPSISKSSAMAQRSFTAALCSLLLLLQPGLRSPSLQCHWRWWLILALPLRQQKQIHWAATPCLPRHLRRCQTMLLSSHRGRASPCLWDQCVRCQLMRMQLRRDRRSSE